MSIVTLEKRVDRMERELKKILKILELVPAVNIAEWKDFSPLDRGILKVLLKKQYAGETTTMIAKELGLENPATSGRVVVWRRLQRITKVSKRIKGAPIVLSEYKRWKLNLDEFTFVEGEDNG